MSASALLSILTGGALNGASGAAVSGTRTEAASLNATETDAAGFADFRHLMDAETTAIKDVETDTVATPDVIASPVVPQAPTALVQGLPLTIAQATSTVDTVEVEVFAASDTGAAQTPDEAQASLTPVPQSEPEQPVTEEEPAGDITTDAVAVPVSAQVQTTAQAPAPTAPAATGSGTATSKAAELAAALLARSAPDETQDVPLAESETVQKSAEAQEVTQMLARQTASAQTTPASQAASRALQAQAAPLKVAPRTSGEASESLAAKEAEAGATKATAETASADAPKPAAPDSRVAAPVTVDAAIPPLTNDTAPQDTDTQAAESATLHPSEVRHADTSRLSRATVETTAQIAASILRKLEGRTTRFDMVLTPEDLGSVEVSMEIDAEGRMTARLAFDNPAAATEMRARAEELRRQLAEAGFQLSEKSLEFTDRESNPRGGFQQFLSDERSNRRAFAGANRLAAEADAPVAPVWTSVTLSPSGVDMKV